MDWAWLPTTLVIVVSISSAAARSLTQLHVLGDVRTWRVAGSICQAKGGQLATVDSATDAVLRQLYKNSNTNNASGKMWIGLRNWPELCDVASVNASTSSTCYMWSDCTRWDSDNHHNGFEGTVTGSTVAQCVAVSQDSSLLWEALDCDTKLPYLCQVASGDCEYATIKGFCNGNYTTTDSTTAMGCEEDCDNDDSCWAYERTKEDKCSTCTGTNPFIYEMSTKGSTIAVKLCFGVVNFGEEVWDEENNETSTENCTTTTTTDASTTTPTTAATSTIQSSAFDDVLLQLGQTLTGDSTNSTVALFNSSVSRSHSLTSNSAVTSTNDSSVSNSNNSEVLSTDTSAMGNVTVATDAPGNGTDTTSSRTAEPNNDTSAASNGTGATNSETAASINGTAEPMDRITAPSNGTGALDSDFQTGRQLCPCRCRHRKPPMPMHKHKQHICRLIASLSVNKSSLSSARRKLISAPDPRASSQTIGWFGVTLVTTVLLIIVLPDVVTLVQYILRRKKVIAEPNSFEAMNREAFSLK